MFKTEKIQSLREIDDIVMLQAMGDACYGDAGGSVWKWMMQRSDTTLITTIMIIMGQKSKLGPRLLVGSPWGLLDIDFVPSYCHGDFL